MGPVVGGLLTEISPRVPFFAYGGSLTVAGLIAAFFLAHTTLHERAAGQVAGEGRTSLREAFRNRAYQAALAANLGTGWALFGVRSSLVPLFVVEGLNVGAIWTGIGFLVGSLVQAVLLLPTGRFVDTVGRRPAMLIGGGLSIVAMLILALTSSVPAFLIAMALFGVGSAHLGVAPAAVVGDVMRGRGGQMVAVFQMAADLGSIVGPLVAGMLADSLSFGAAFGATAGVLVLGPLLALRMPETRWTPMAQTGDHSSHVDAGTDSEPGTRTGADGFAPARGADQDACLAGTSDDGVDVSRPDGSRGPSA